MAVRNYGLKTDPETGEEYYELTEMIWGMLSSPAAVAGVVGVDMVTGGEMIGSAFGLGETVVTGTADTVSGWLG